jgi:hypothetical protein
MMKVKRLIRIKSKSVTRSRSELEARRVVMGLNIVGF